MKYQKKILAIPFIIFCTFLWALLLFSVFNFNKQIAYSATDKLIIDLGGYEEGTWAKEDVTVSATVVAGVEEPQIFYAINSQLDEDFKEYQGEFVVTDEGGDFKNANIIQFKIKYKAFEQTKTEYSSLIKINVDKKKPVIEKIEISEQGFTQNPVTVRIFILDSNVYEAEYRATILGEEFEPLEEYLANRMIVFELTTEENLTLKKGSIVIMDQAKNEVVYDKDIVIDNIESHVPDFYVSLLNGKNQGEKYIEIKLGHIHSEAKEVVIKHPSGKSESLQIQQVQKIKIKKNGTYLIKVVSNAGNTYTRGIIVDEIKSIPLNFMLFVFMVVGLSVAGVFVARRAFIKNDKIVVIKKNKNN